MAMQSLPGGAAQQARRCIDSVAGFVPLSACAFYRIDAELKPRDYVLHRVGARTHQTYLSQFQHLDPLHPARVSSANRPVVPLGAAMPAPVRRRSGYGAFLARHDRVDVVELFVRRQGRIVAGFSLIRGAELGPFTARDIETLERLHGLIELALEGGLDEVRPDADAGHRLTPREWEIARRVRDGACNKTIARELGVGLSTVKTHLQRLYRKLGVARRTELVSVLFLAAGDAPERKQAIQEGLNNNKGAWAPIPTKQS